MTDEKFICGVIWRGRKRKVIVGIASACSEGAFTL